VTRYTAAGRTKAATLDSNDRPACTLERGRSDAAPFVAAWLETWLLSVRAPAADHPLKKEERSHEPCAGSDP
jgi:hypothetical protein